MKCYRAIDENDGIDTLFVLDEGKLCVAPYSEVSNFLSYDKFSCHNWSWSSTSKPKMINPVLIWEK